MPAPLDGGRASVLYVFAGTTIKRDDPRRGLSFLKAEGHPEGGLKSPRHQHPETVEQPRAKFREIQTGNPTKFCKLDGATCRKQAHHERDPDGPQGIFAG